jgi:hypoxanthine phosphoribosyltransferase
LLVVPRGGYYPANIVSRELNFGAVDILHASMSSYELAGASKRQEFRYGQMPSEAEIKGHNVLIIEEVCDTGHTLNELVIFLHELGAKTVRTAALCYKPARSETGFVPDWYVTRLLIIRTSM